MDSAAVPTFYLYGEPHRAVARDFVHVEDLDDRSRPSEWTIRPHAHAELDHLFLIRSGGGVVRFEDEAVAFAAPALIAVPAAVVHGFAWTEESTGWVMTAARPYLAAIATRHPDLMPLIQDARVIALDRSAAARADGHMADMARELGWSMPGHEAAIEASLLALVIMALRRFGTTAPVQHPPSPQAALVARFRERIEQRFRQREPVHQHAAALSVSESALRAACMRISGASPMAMINQRALVEARRALLYTNLSVSKVGYSLGFVDPAYFSRFFARHAGVPPQQYRASRGSSGSGVRTGI